MIGCFSGLSGNCHCASVWGRLLYGITCSGIGPALATRWTLLSRDAKELPRDVVGVGGIGGGMLGARGRPRLAMLEPLAWHMARAINS